MNKDSKLLKFYIEERIGSQFCVQKEEYTDLRPAGFENITKDTVVYDLEMFKGNLCTSCKLFTSESIGFVPFYKYVKKGNQDISSVLKICSELGYEYEFRRMIFVDSLIFNQDRHLGNFGFLVDNDTFEIKGFAPLFDYNMALMCRAVDGDLSINEPMAYINNFFVEHKLGGEFAKVGKAILTPDMRDKLKYLKHIEIIPHEKYNLPEERLAILSKALQQNYNQIMDRVNVWMPVRE